MTALKFQKMHLMSKLYAKISRIYSDRKFAKFCLDLIDFEKGGISELYNFCSELKGYISQEEKRLSQEELIEKFKNFKTLIEKHPAEQLDESLEDKPTFFNSHAVKKQKTEKAPEKLRIFTSASFFNEKILPLFKIAAQKNLP